jgi:hypothetical protein
MFPLVEFPELIQHYAPFFDDVFSAEAFIEFQRYISGLVVSENKTVDGINRLFVHESRNQSSLNRLLTQSPFSLDVLNEKRLALLASLPGTQMKHNGVLSVDDTLLTHYGQHLRYCQMLWIGTPSAASIQGVGMNSSSGSGSHCSISASPFGNSTPTLTRATR